MLNAKLILLNLDSLNVFISLQVKLLIDKFLYKNMVPVLYEYVSVYIKYLHYIYII